jgi:hypothetical protein
MPARGRRSAVPPLIPAPAGALRYCLLATLGGIMMPVAAATDLVVSLAPRAHAAGSLSRALVIVVLAVLAIVAAGATALVAQLMWRWAGFPEAGLSDFLPNRWLRRAILAHRARVLVAELQRLPPGVSPDAHDLLIKLAGAVAGADAYEAKRPEQRAQLCTEVAERAGLTARQIQAAELAALLQDLGTCTIPAMVLHKHGPLSPGEAEQVRAHPGLAAGLMAPYVDPEVTAAVRGHHERPDGRGYPDGLAAGAVPPLARILAVVDTYDALLRNRPYRRGRSPIAAFDELREAAAGQLDPQLVEALIALEGGRTRPYGSFWPATLARPLRWCEHLLAGSAVPAAAALTALAVGAVAWFGQVSVGAATATAASRSGVTPAPPPAFTEPATPSPSPDAQPSPAPTPLPTLPPVGPGAAAPAAAAAKPSPSRSPSPKLKPPLSSAKQHVTPPSSPAPVFVPVGQGASPAASAAPSPSPSDQPATFSPWPPASPSPEPSPPASAAPTGPAPAVSSIQPSSGPSRGGTTVRITGSGFAGATAVMFGGTGARSFTVNSGTSITAVSPAGDGTVDVIVVTPAGRSTGGGPLTQFTYDTFILVLP